MPVTITIRSVPDDVRNALAARAKWQGKSLQEYLQGELRNLADGPTMEEWLAEVRAKRASSPQANISSDDIVAAIHEAREERMTHLMNVIQGQDDDGTERPE